MKVLVINDLDINSCESCLRNKEKYTRSITLIFNVLDLFFMSKLKIETKMKQTSLLNSQIDVDYTKLYDYGGDMNKRWSIAFKVWDFSKNGFTRRFDYDVDKIESKTARYQFAKKRIKEINKILKQGACFGLEDKKKVYRKTVESAFWEGLELKLLQYDDESETGRSVRSAIGIFIEYLIDTGIHQIDISNLSKVHFLEYRDWLLKNRKVVNGTVNNYVGYCNIILNEIVSREWIPKNPITGLDKLKEVDSLKNREFTKEERQLMKLHLKKNKALWIYTQFIYYCWLRPKEVAKLRVNQIDLDRGKIKIIKADQSKQKKIKYIDIPAPFFKVLKDLPYPKNEDQFFFAHDGQDKLFGFKQFAKNRFSTYHSAIRDEIGLSKEVKFYGWKRNGVCDAYRSGVGIYEITKHGGWSSMNEAQVYLEKSGLMINNDIIIKMPEI